jgi:hypothetical protein
MAFLGLATTIWGVILLIYGVLALFKGAIGQSLKAPLAMIPIGNPKLWAVIFIVGGLAFGGIGVLMGAFSSASTNLSTGTITGGSTNNAVSAMGLENCYFASYGVVGASAANASWVTDTADLSHLTLTLNNATDLGSRSVNGTITCYKKGDIEKAYQVNCAFKGGAFRNQVSTTDANQYYMVATSASASRVPSLSPWLQTAYINSGAIATTSSSQEYSPLVFAGAASTSPEASKTIGFYFTLPSATQIKYLNNQNSVDDSIVCDTNNDGTYDQTVGRITVTKIVD